MRERSRACFGVQRRSFSKEIAIKIKFAGAYRPICSCIPFDRPALCARTQKPRRHGRVHVAELPLRVRPLRQHDADKRQRRGQQRSEHTVERDHARKIPVRKRREQSGTISCARGSSEKEDVVCRLRLNEVSWSLQTFLCINLDGICYSQPPSLNA